MLDNDVAIDLHNTKEVKSVTKVLFGEPCLNLTESVSNNNLNAVKFFLNRKINPNNNYNMSGLLLHSVKNNNLDITKALLSNGANIDEVDKNGDTPLLFALKADYLELVQFLLSRNANFEAKDKDNMTPLLLACKIGNLKLVQFLFNKNANVEVKNINKDTILTIAAESGHKDIVEFLLVKQVPYRINDNVDLTTNITKCLFRKSYGTILEAIKSGDVEIVKFFVKYGINLNTKYNGFTPLIYAVCLGNMKIINFILQYVKDKTFSKPLNKIELLDYDQITLYIKNTDVDVEVEVNDLGLKIEYTADQNKHINWLQKSNELQSVLKTNRFQLFDNLNGKYGVFFYNNSNEADLVLKLKINNQHVTLVKSFEHHHSKILLFEPLLGVETEVWHREKKLIEDILKTPVTIDDYRPGHYLFNYDISAENLICIEENSTAALPKKLNIQGKFINFYTQDKVNKYVFSNIDDAGYKEWNSKLLEIQELLASNVEIESYDQSTKTLILSDATHDVLPAILKIKDDQGNIPHLLKHKIDGKNEFYYYQYLYSIPLSTWKANIAMNNLNVILNKPNHIFKISECTQSSDEFDKSLLDSGVNTTVLLQALTALPRSIVVDNANYLKKGEVFWGYAPGDKKYYTSVHDVVHTMIIGGTGSGKSTLMNGVILSLLHNIEEIGKLFLVDLKGGVEFGPYEQLESEKITVFAEATKPSKLLNAVKEIEAQIKLRLKYQKEIGVKKFDYEAIYFVIDEFAEISTMDDGGDGNEMMAKQKIKDKLSSIAKQGRSVNVKLIVQSQNPNDIGDLKNVLLSRILLKTPESIHSDITLTKSGIEEMKALGLNHTSFNAGRLYFEDNNPEKASAYNELQYPLLVRELKSEKEGLFKDENIYSDYFLTYKESVRSSKSQLNAKMEHLIPSLYEDYEYLRDTELFSKYKKPDEQISNEEVKQVDPKINILDNIEIEYSDKEKEIFNMFQDM